MNTRQVKWIGGGAMLALVGGACFISEIFTIAYENDNF